MSKCRASAALNCRPFCATRDAPFRSFSSRHSPKNRRAYGRRGTVQCASWLNHPTHLLSSGALKRHWRHAMRPIGSRHECRMGAWLILRIGSLPYYQRLRAPTFKQYWRSGSFSLESSAGEESLVLKRTHATPRIEFDQCVSTTGMPIPVNPRWE